MNKGMIPSEARLETKYTAPELEYHRLLHWVQHHSHGFFTLIRKITVRFGKPYPALVLEPRLDIVGTESLFFQRKELWNLKTVKISTHGRIAINFQ